jgi:hypothetical protein
MSIRWFKQVLLFLILPLLCLGAEQPARTPLAMKNPIQDKNFYLFSAIEWTPAVRTLVKSDKTLAEITTAKREALSEAAKTCGGDAACYAKAMRWSDDEIAKAGAALGALASNLAMRQLLEGPVLQSGLYQRYSGQPAQTLIEKAWEDAARKMNKGIDVFALGQVGSHSFDAGAFDMKSRDFTMTMQMIGAVMEANSKSLELFFQPAMQFTIELLHAQLRDEAGRHEPMEKGDNKEAFQRIPTIKWAQFPYTAIVVLGLGPERADLPLAPAGRLRLVPAVQAYREGKAPFILVSGGYVHPPQTPYSEAIEMKKSLMKEFGVPENAIIVDPHARITATNMRNAARLIYRYNMPFDKKALVISDPGHIDGVQGIRNAKGPQMNITGAQPGGGAPPMNAYQGLGYAPYTIGARLSPFMLEFTPTIISLSTDLNDLMDP